MTSILKVGRVVEEAIVMKTKACKIYVPCSETKL